MKWTKFTDSDPTEGGYYLVQHRSGDMGFPRITVTWFDPSQKDVYNGGTDQWTDGPHRERQLSWYGPIPEAPDVEQMFQSFGNVRVSVVVK